MFAKIYVMNSRLDEKSQGYEFGKLLLVASMACQYLTSI